jgi:sialate O-acetylesterase
MKRFFLVSVPVFIFSFFTALPGFAKISLPEFFSDNMVLQQRTEAPIWGTSTPNKNLTITTSWDEKSYDVKTGADGKWFVKLRTIQAGGPHFIVITDGEKEKVILKNVLLGEVWLCSGQSNMEMPLGGWGKVLNYKNEIDFANYPNVRLLHIKKTTALQPEEKLETLTNGWQACSPLTISEFSSVAYFFGRDLNTDLKVPVGLINASWGGTVAEAWTSAESLNQMTDFQGAIQVLKDYSKGRFMDAYDDKMKDWERQVFAVDKGFTSGLPHWAANKYIDANWATMNLPSSWEKAELTNFDGVVWFRKTIEIPKKWVGKELVLSLDKIDDNDITYFNGEKIGATDGPAVERIYTIPGKLVRRGDAVITVRITDIGGEGGLTGERAKMYLALKTQKVTSSVMLSGDWKYQPSVNFKDIPAPANPADPNKPTVLYNAMINPLAPYAIQGVIWYQGESNANRADQYKELFPLLIKDWRRAWGQDFPFFFVQLANYKERQPNPSNSKWAELREAQLQTLRVENTGMAVTIDIGEANDIHPKNKQEVGRRLALIAKTNIYKDKRTHGSSGPIYKGYEVEYDQIRIRFDYVESGLKTKDGKKPEGFAIAGSDRKFYWADAVIEGDEIVVSSPHVNRPVAVRYAWADNPACNLYNKNNLPASPFRTDNWQ